MSIPTVLVFKGLDGGFREANPRNPSEQGDEELRGIPLRKLLIGDELILCGGSWTVYRRVWRSVPLELRIYVQRSEMRCVREARRPDVHAARRRAARALLAQRERGVHALLPAR